MTRLARAALGVGVGVGVAVAALPGAAVAATAELAYDEPVPGVVEAAYALSVRAGPGEANRISVSSSGDAYTVADGGAALTAGDGCAAVTPSEVRCPTVRATPDRSVFVDAGDGDDRLGLGPLEPNTLTELRGGSGADLVFGGAGHDLLFGGAGIDGLVGGTGFDELDGGPGDDVLHGGSGTDTASYEQRKRAVTVDLADGTGGESGEADVLSEIEEVVGGHAADDLRGSSGADSLLGGEGEAHDRADGRAGDDVVIAHRAYGGPGNDSVDGRVVSCGPGQDAVYRGSHRAPGPFPRACEVVVAVFVVVRAQPVATGRRRAVLAVRCARAPRCRGALELRDGRGRLGRARFSVRRGRNPAAMHRVRIRLARRPARPLATLRISGVRAYQRSSFKMRLR
jgi:hypothetical protein